LSLEPQLYLTDRVTLSGEASYTWFDEWLLWDFASEQLATYEADLYDINLKLDWYPSTRQEVRIKLQWVGVQADAREGFRLDNGGNMQPSEIPVDDFSVSDTALQIRYRYEMAPLSDFYLVYTRGGYWDDEDTSGSAYKLFSNGWDDRTFNQILAKISYRF
jgi:hypothetical protein